MKASLISILFLGAVLLVPGKGAERKFTSTDAKEMVAEIISATETEVTIKKSSDGKEYTLPLTRLSEADRKFVAAWVDEKPNMRPERQVELAQQAGGPKKMTVPKGNYLSADGTLTLYPGDTVNLEFAKEGDKWGAPKVVAEVKNPERTITFGMTQNAQITMLNRTTKIQSTVAFDCKNCPVGSDDFERTNIVPTEKGFGGNDSWPGTTWILRLSNFEVSERPAAEVYQERSSK